MEEYTTNSTISITKLAVMIHGDTGDPRGGGVHYIHFGYGDVPLGRVSIFQILV